ncbi:MFS transporter [Candidatus Bathyarchaeota archaeon]|nr:MFS transporter [Candidatus Bathyarchaeota archaeon]
MKGEDVNRLRSLVFLAFGVFSLNFAFAIYGSTYTNFLVNELGIEALQIGVLESIREVPGLLTAFILGPMLRFTQPFLASLFLIVFGLGMCGVSTVSDWVQVVFWSFIWSVGFHCWNPIRSSMTLGLSERSREGKRLGQMNSVASIAGMVAMAFVAVFSSLTAMKYRLFFIIGGLTSIAGSLVVLRVKLKHETSTRTRLVFRRRYTIYYTLNFLEGARRQIFLTFAPFALVKVYGLNVTVIALLMFVSRFLTFFSSPYVGKIVDRVGPRLTLTVSYVLMIGDFLGFAYIHDVHFLLFLYLLNSILMVVSYISQTTYVNELSSTMDLVPSLAMGQTMNHIAAVTLPLTGGIMWNVFGYEATFFIGVAVALCSLITTQGIRCMRPTEGYSPLKIKG